jgi:hypothetical protein
MTISHGRRDAGFPLMRGCMPIVADEAETIRTACAKQKEQRVLGQGLPLAGLADSGKMALVFVRKSGGARTSF